MTTGKEQKLLGYHQQPVEEDQNNITAGRIDMNSSVGKLPRFLFFPLTHLA
jgi:hypothetical protein